MSRPRLEWVTTDLSQHLGYPAPALRTLGDRTPHFLSFPVPLRLAQTSGVCQRAGRADLPSWPTWPAPPLQDWLQRPQKQARSPGPEHHLSALHGSGRLISMATVQCEGILASLGRALSSINRGCSRLHAYYEQSQALSTGNYA